jgi:hypothetical protein
MHAFALKLDHADQNENIDFIFLGVSSIPVVAFRGQG